MPINIPAADTSGRPGPDAPGQRSMRLGPVGALAGIHDQLHVQMDGGVGGAFHHLAGARDKVVHRVLGHFEQQLVVHL